MAGGIIGVDDWNKIIADHGQPVSQKSAHDQIDYRGQKKDDPFPTVTYQFADGTSLTIKGIASTAGQDSTKFQWTVIDQKGILDNPKDKGAPKTTAPGSSSDQWLLQTDPKTGETTWIPNKNYVPPSSAATRAVSAGTSDQYIVTMNPDGSLNKQPNPNYVDPAPLIQIKAYQDNLQQQIDAGKLSNQQAIALFDAKVQEFNVGQDAGLQAVKIAQAANENRVGPQFGQHFADALSGRGVNFTGADFSYPTPDYAGIARLATAQAIAHLSPTAAAIAATMAPPGGYGAGASSGGAYIPGGGGGGSGSTPGGAPAAAAPAQLAPGVIRDSQGNPGFIAPDGRFIQAQTTPAPPQPGFGGYRPGG